jgi:hypothetical protein
MSKRNTNGHAEPQVRANGHAPESTEQDGLAAPGESAVSHDGGGVSLANTSISAGAANAARTAHGGAARSSTTVTTARADEKGVQPVHFPGPTDSEAMQDAGAYVNAVAERVDLVAASVRLVESGDEKIAKSELDRLRDMKFGKVGPPVIEEQAWPDLGNLPRPLR